MALHGINKQDILRFAEDIVNSGRLSTENALAIRRFARAVYQEIDYIHRLWQWGPNEIEWGDGGAVAEFSNQPIRPTQTLAVISYETERLDVPVHAVSEPAWSRHLLRTYYPIPHACEIRRIVGTIIVEPLAPSILPTKRWRVELGPRNVQAFSANTLLGFDLGFVRYDDDAGRFFVRVIGYPPEENDEIVNEIPAVYVHCVSLRRVLDDAYLACYTEPGLRFGCYLGVYG